jgi:hypothetical protein
MTKKPAEKMAIRHGTANAAADAPDEKIRRITRRKNDFLFDFRLVFLVYGKYKSFYRKNHKIKAVASC